MDNMQKGYLGMNNEWVGGLNEISKTTDKHTKQLNEAVYKNTI